MLILNKERSQKTKELHARQSREIEQFDLHSLSLGLDAIDLNDFTLDDDLLDSVRSSTISLPTSPSSSSIRPHSSTMR